MVPHIGVRWTRLFKCLTKPGDVTNPPKLGTEKNWRIPSASILSHPISSRLPVTCTSQYDRKRLMCWMKKQGWGVHYILYYFFAGHKIHKVCTNPMMTSFRLERVSRRGRTPGRISSPSPTSLECCFAYSTILAFSSGSLGAAVCHIPHTHNIKT